MGSGLVINNLSTGGQVYKLKDDVSIEAAHQKGQKDGLDQVYFTAGKDKYVLEGDNLKLGELKEVAKGQVPTTLVKLNGKPVEIKIEKVDDEVSNVGEGFVQHGNVASVSVSVGGIGVGVATLSGLAALITMGAAKGSVTKAITTGGIYVGLAAAAAGVVGLAYYGGKSIYDGASNKPDSSKTESIKKELVNTDNNARPAGLISVKDKVDAVVGVATDIVLDGVIDQILK